MKKAALFFLLLTLTSIAISCVQASGCQASHKRKKHYNGIQYR